MTNTAAHGTSVNALLARRAAEAGSSVAFIEGATGATLTWSDLLAGTRAWQAVAGAGDSAATLGGGKRVGLLVRDPLAMVGAYLAALAVGVAVAPLNPEGAAPERRRQVQALGLAALVTDDPEVDDAGLERWLLGPGGPAPAGAPIADGPTAGEAGAGSVLAPPAAEAAVILASSGTTGDPKIIPLTEAQLLHTASALVDHHGLGAADRGYCPLPLFHINALVVGVLSAVVAGSSLVVDGRFSARSFWPLVEAHEVTWLNLVPAIIGIVAEMDSPPAAVADRVAFARSASAPLPAATRERFEARTGIGVLETYGMTEAASQIAANPRRQADRRPGSVGRPVGVSARVVDGDGSVLPAGEVGEVQISGPSVVEVYWQPVLADGAARSRPATSDEGWLSTGDLGRLDSDGYLYLVGRLDDVINRGGEKVFPRDVEEVLLRDDEVTAAAVVGRPHPRFGHEPVAFVLAREGADRAALAERLDRLCQRELSRFRRPATITVADSLPAGPTGKIRHAQLRRELALAGGTPRGVHEARSAR